MLFNSLNFIIFLPIVFLLYWFVCKNNRWQNILIVVASYIFYGWWDPRFLILIFITSLCSFISGLLLERNEGRDVVRKAISAGNIILNLGILGFFKYYNFFADSINTLSKDLFHYDLGWTALNIILPVGISFYTFQALSYSIDVYRHRIRATRDPIAFFAYISFFPQLVAGPIERATNLLPQFQASRHFDYGKAVDGLRQMLWGFFKKIVIADSCANIVNQYWSQYNDLSGSMLVVLTILFSFQIYGDFSGYSDIAIGCSRLFGIRLMQNFNLPYFSRSIPEFWRRWHISLMTWFRDYIYFPLGGSRTAKWKIIRNIFIVWTISGLWHGANWTFVCWGIYHACIISIYALFGIQTKYPSDIAIGKILPSFREFLQMVLTFILVSVGWIIFRSESISSATGFFGALSTRPFFSPEVIKNSSLLIWCLILIIIEWIQRGCTHALQFPDNRVFRQRWVRWAIYYFIIFVIIYSLLINAHSPHTFIYFQF